MNKKKKGSNIVIYIVSILAVLLTAYLSYKFYYLVATEFAFLPAKYIKYLLIALSAICVIFALIAFIRKVANWAKVVQIILCAALSYGLIQGLILVPQYKGQVERMFTEIPTEGELAISVYTLADSNVKNLSDLVKEETKVAIVEAMDEEAQGYALKVMSRELNGSEIKTINYESMYDLADALYKNEVDAIILNESYAELLSDNSDFLDFDTKTKKLYTSIMKTTVEFDTNAVGNITKEPFIVAISGNDAWSYKKINAVTKCGRSDVNMLAIVNPNTKQILLVTIPRDSYVGLEGNSKKMDKLTHATVYSIAVWEKTINALLDVDINYFVRINFSSLINVVDSLGGVDIVNPTKFMSDYYGIYDETKKETVYNEIVFEEGPLHLDGTQALCYVRERHNLPDGDKGRNVHQAIVIKALVDKATSVETISNFGNVLTAISGTFNTDLNIDQIWALVGMQLDDMATWDIQTYGLTGTGGLYPSYAMGGRELYCMPVDGDSLNTAKTYIQKVLNNEVLNIAD